MTYEPFLIAPWNSPDAGLSEYYKPWLVGNDAFPVIEDAYEWRGTVKKREGFVVLNTGGALPTTPIMGLKNYIIPSTAEQQLIAFSTTKAYLFSNSTSSFTNISFLPDDTTPVSWTGTSSQFFWTGQFANALWATNSSSSDHLRFWNGDTSGGWNIHQPIVNGSTTLDGCLIVLPYKGRLVVLNTVEGSNAFRQRARWSKIGNPYLPNSAGVYVPPAPFSNTGNVNNWRDDIPGNGGFIDADTNEQIVSAGIVRDVLIVFFQRSTWRLRYTGNETLPFLWERINTVYGSEATFSTIPYDDVLLTFSRFGFIAADTNSVRRFDEKIPDQSFSINAGGAVKNLINVQGIRDFYRQVSYWTYSNQMDTSDVDTKILAYNYLEKSFARFNQDFRTFGYYQNFNDLTWQLATYAWENTDDTWFSPTNLSEFPLVIAADDSSGNVYIVYDNQDVTQDNGTNFGFDIRTKQFNPYIKEGHRCKLGFVDIYCTGDPEARITLNHYIDDNLNDPVISKIVDLSTLNNARYVRVYLGTIGRFHQIQLTLTPDQIADPATGTAQFILQGMVLWTSKQGRIKTG